jgi:hypothetical protein
MAGDYSDFLPAIAIPLEFAGRNSQAAPQVWPMCNLYSITKNQAAIRDLFSHYAWLPRRSFHDPKWEQSLQPRLD